MPEHKDTPKYFWSDELAGPAFRELALAFVLVSVADLLATWKLLAMGVIREGNALANWMLHEYGGRGFIAFKFLLVGCTQNMLGILAEQSVHRLCQHSHHPGRRART